jgi:hypothetical protein
MPRSMPRLQQTQRTRNARVVRGLGLRGAPSPCTVLLLYSTSCLRFNRRQRTWVSH